MTSCGAKGALRLEKPSSRGKATLSQVGELHTEGTKRDAALEATAWELLDLQPIYNELTIYSVVMSPATGTSLHPMRHRWKADTCSGRLESRVVGVTHHLPTTSVCGTCGATFSQTGSPGAFTKPPSHPAHPLPLAPSNPSLSSSVPSNSLRCHWSARRQLGTSLSTLQATGLGSAPTAANGTAPSPTAAPSSVGPAWASATWESSTGLAASPQIAPPLPVRRAGDTPEDEQQRPDVSPLLVRC